MNGGLARVGVLCSVLMQKLRTKPTDAGLNGWVQCANGWRKEAGAVEVHLVRDGEVGWRIEVTGRPSACSQARAVYLEDLSKAWRAAEWTAQHYERRQVSSGTQDVAAGAALG